MGQFSVEIYALPGSLLSGNQQFRRGRLLIMPPARIQHGRRFGRSEAIPRLNALIVELRRLSLTEPAPAR